MTVGEHPAILYGVLCSWLAGVPRLAVVIAMVLVLIEGILLNLLLSDVGLVSQSSLLPTLLYVVAMSVGATTLTPIILVWLLVIFCLKQLMLHGTSLTISSIQICNATALIGIATMFYLPAVALMLSYLLIASSYRLYNWKDWTLMLLGFAAPYAALLSVLFLTGGILEWWRDVLDGLGSIVFSMGSFAPLQTLGTLVLLLVLLWSLLNVNLHLSEHPIMWQKNASTVMLFVVGAIGMILYSRLQPTSLQLFAAPFAFCATRFLLDAANQGSFHAKKRHLWVYDILFILIILSAFVC